MPPKKRIKLCQNKSCRENVQSSVRMQHIRGNVSNEDRLNMKAANTANRRSAREKMSEQDGVRLTTENTVNRRSARATISEQDEVRITTENTVNRRSARAEMSEHQNMRANPQELAFADWLLKLGENKLSDSPLDGCVEIPTQCVCTGDLIEEVFGNILNESNIKKIHSLYNLDSQK
jgi:hypothetical protein